MILTISARCLGFICAQVSTCHNAQGKMAIGSNVSELQMDELLQEVCVGWHLLARLNHREGKIWLHFMSIVGSIHSINDLFICRIWSGVVSKEDQA